MGYLDFEDYLDFFNRYLMGSALTFTQFYFYAKFLEKTVNPAYCLALAILEIGTADIFSMGDIAEFVWCVLLLAASGVLICKVRGAATVLYAIITAQMMQFMFGIFHSALCLLYPLSGAFSRETAGVLFMLLGYLAWPAAIVCCRITEKYFSHDKEADAQYALMTLTPVLMIFLIGGYIHSVVYGNTITTDSSGVVGGANHVQALAVQLLGLASLFCMMFSYKKLVENFRLSSRLSMLEQEERFLSQYVAEAKTAMKRQIPSATM